MGSDLHSRIADSLSCSILEAAVGTRVPSFVLGLIYTKALTVVSMIVAGIEECARP